MHAYFLSTLVHIFGFTWLHKDKLGLIGSTGPLLKNIQATKTLKYVLNVVEIKIFDQNNNIVLWSLFL